MKGNVSPQIAGDDARHAAWLRRELFNRIKNKKLMLDTSAQKNNLIKRLERIHLIKWLSGKGDNTPKIKIFQCCFCRLWQPGERLCSRVHWDARARKVQIFRICQACRWICQKMDIELRFI